MTRDEALSLLREYVMNEGLVRHMLSVEATMRFYAEKFGEDVERWGLIGLLHDFDWEIHPTLEEHPQAGASILRECGVPEDIVQDILSHADHTVALGLVGRPVHDDMPHLVAHLVSGNYVPVVATIGAGADGTLYNVNADTMAAALAVRLRAARLLIAGTTPGVLDGAGRTIARLDARAEHELAAAGTVNRGMLAKLQACRAALAGGVGDVAIVDGRDIERLRAALAGDAHAEASLTRVV